MSRKSHCPPPEGRYSNYFKIGHNADVFVIDYFQIFPEDHEDESDIEKRLIPKARIITSPSDAIQLMNQLKSSIKAFEKDHGPIQDVKVNKSQ
jgi:hypothetical protein